MAFPNLNDTIATKLTALLHEKRKRADWLARKAGAGVDLVKNELKPANSAESAVKGGVSTGLAAATKGLEITKQIGSGAHALTAGAHTLISNTMHVNPVTWAAKPWIAAWDVVKIQNALEKMYAICDGPGNPYALKYGMKESYACTCSTRTWFPFVAWDSNKLPFYSKRPRTSNGDSRDQTCNDLYKYFVSQKESKVIRIVTAVFLPPVYLAFAAGESMRKKEVLSSAKNNVNTQALLSSALPMVSETVAVPGGEHIVKVKEEGCQRAQAIIALWLGELNLSDPSGSEGSYYKTVELMVHPDGYEALTGKLSSGVILKTG